jgi:hypothetical protein
VKYYKATEYRHKLAYKHDIGYVLYRSDDDGKNVHWFGEENWAWTQCSGKYRSINGVRRQFDNFVEIEEGDVFLSLI